MYGEPREVSSLYPKTLTQLLETLSRLHYYAYEIGINRTYIVPVTGIVGTLPPPILLKGGYYLPKIESRGGFEIFC